MVEKSIKAAGKAGIRFAKEKAKQICEQNEVIIASKKDAELFFNSILNVELPNKALSDAAERYLQNLN